MRDIATLRSCFVIRGSSKIQKPGRPQRRPGSFAQQINYGVGGVGRSTWADRSLGGAPCKRSRKYVLERVRTRRTATGVPLTLKTRSTSFLSLCPSDFARPLSSFATNVKTSSARSNNVLGACCSSPWRSYHLFANSSSSSPLTSALSRKISRLSLNPSTPAFSRMPDTARIHSPKLSKTPAVPLGHPESIQCCTMDKAADGVTHVSIDRMYRAAQKWTRWAVSMTRWK